MRPIILVFDLLKFSQYFFKSYPSKTMQRLHFLFFVPFLLFLNNISAQNPQLIPGTTAKPVQLRDATCNFAGTFELGAFIGQSNDHDLDTIYLCFNDSIYVQHNGDVNFSGDPVPATPPGIGYTFYDCPPTISGPDLSSIQGDGCLTPGGSNGIWSYSAGTSGSVWFYNNGILQNTFNAGNPIGLWFAPMTIDAIESFGFESAQVGLPPGPCVNVNTDVSFKVIYLNPIEGVGAFIDPANPCVCRFRPRGGYPQWDLSGRYTMEIELVSDSTIHGQQLTADEQIVNNAFVYFSVPQPGKYRVRLSDGKSCEGTFEVNMGGCDGVNNIQLELADVQSLKNQVVCQPLVVQQFDAAAVTFSLQWDPNLLEFQEIIDLHPNIENFVGGANVFLDQVYAGKLSMLFYNTQNPGTSITLPNGDTLLQVCFKSIGMPDTCTQVMFANAPAGLVFEDVTGAVLPVNAEGGDFCIRSVLDAGNTLKTQHLHLMLSPSLSVAGSPVQVGLDGSDAQANMGALEVWNEQGQLIFKRQIQIENGYQQWTLSTEGWATGVYLVRVQTENALVSSRMLIGQ